MEEHRSGCPINLSLEVLGDKWSLVIIRDMMFGNRRHFRELLHDSEEGIASNILSDRLHRLTEHGLVSRAPDPSHKQKVIYSLTEPAIQLVPVHGAPRRVGAAPPARHPRAGGPCRTAGAGGPELWEQFMDELREQHLGIPGPAGSESVFARLRAAYEAELARRTNHG